MLQILKNKTVIVAIVAIALVLLLSSFSVKKLFGRQKSELTKKLQQEKQEIKAEKKIIDEKLAQSDYFNPNTLNKYPVTYQLPAADADKLVRKIHYELIWWGGRLSKMEGYFGNLTHIVQCAQLSKLYSLKYNRSLTTDISKYMTKKQVQSLYNIISKLKQ